MDIKRIIYYRKEIKSEKWKWKNLNRINYQSSESQKGVNAVQWCSAENQNGAIAIDFVQR